MQIRVSQTRRASLVRVSVVIGLLPPEQWVTQANLILDQMKQTPNVKYVLLPNQHIGAYKTSFMPQWVAREYLARRGNAEFNDSQITPARCNLLGYALKHMRIEGKYLPKELF